ncbi:MAG: NAD(P)/FAD-dependent oxidoreductase [Caldilineales bacterium]|nr:NAD(P)/FAD-dependent oxidoreductase [Caldilineales bacterium]
MATNAPEPRRASSPARFSYDAIVVGSGPNGLAAAITLAQAGCRVALFEARQTVGGGMRSAELTLPGFVHDICSAVHPLGIASPFFKTLPLTDYGLDWVHPEIPVAHPLDNGSAAVLHRSLPETAAGLGRDGRAWAGLFGPLAADWDILSTAILGSWPSIRHPFVLARFGMRALTPAAALAQTLFREKRARALFAGLAAHAIQPLEHPLTSSFGLVLGALGHVVGWPFPRGGAQKLADALAAYLRSLGADIVTGSPVTSLLDLPPTRAILLDLAPLRFLDIAGDALPPAYRRKLERYRYGPAAFKVDYALAGPVPWRAEECRRAGTIHLGGTLAEIAASERAIWRGEHPARPYVLVGQQSLFDASRAPEGQHTLWAYCHTPNGSTVDMSERIENQIERFAPGFQDVILARHMHNPAQLQAYNPNYVGGDINVGVQDWRQLWTRPAVQRNPYATSLEGVYLCSSATPPGGGVHGMCGYHAARAALAEM